MSTDPSIRAGDDDRERVAAALREHYAAGRISAEELEERLTATWSARTVGELQVQIADLPPEHEVYELPVPARPVGSAVHHQAGRVDRHDQALRARLASYVGLVALMLVIWVASGGGYFWPIWVIAPGGIGLLTSVLRGRDR